VNDEAQMPFGGKAAIAEFTDLRWITIEDSQQHYPF
jgi:vanillin dehydrogenase